MKIAIISDTHNMHKQVKLEDIEGCDLLIHCGDFCGSGAFFEAESFMSWLEMVRDMNIVKEIVFVAGNHDRCFEDSPDSCRALIPEGVHYLEDSGIELFGYNIWGSPQSPAFCGWAFGPERGFDINRYWKMIPDDTDILITHGPPFNIMDVSVYDKISVGCEALLERTMSLRPKLHCFGHIHNWTGTEEHHGIKFVNASQVTEQYELNKRPVIVEI